MEVFWADLLVKRRKEKGEMRSNYATVIGLYNMQKSGNSGDSDEGWGLELRKAGNFLFSMVMGFV